MIGLRALLPQRPVSSVYGTRMSAMGLTPGQSLTVAKGTAIIWDMSITLGVIDNQGVIMADPAVANVGAGVELICDRINNYNGGLLVIGAPSATITGKAIVTLNGAESGRGTRYVVDDRQTDGRFSPSSSTAALTGLEAGTGIQAGTYTITRNDATNFTVTGPSAYSAAGTLNTFFDGQVKFTLTVMPASTHTIRSATRAFFNDGAPRSIQANSGGGILVYGQVLGCVRTVLDDHIEAGSSTMVLRDPAHGWAVGDEIAVGSTDFYGYCSAEKRTIATISSDKKTITVTAPFTYFHWGKLQYVDETATNYLSLTAANHPNKPHADIPSVYDMRAPVMHLTRPVVFRSANDSAWTTSKFGIHCMVMRNSVGHFEGLEIQRGGQQGAVGRYPLHFHVLSYNQPRGTGSPSDGTFVGAPIAANEVRGCVINSSGQRAVVVHGTHNLTAADTNAWDIAGHAFFQEDAVEKATAYLRNTAMNVRNPPLANALVLSDSDAVGGGGAFAGATGFWWSNPGSFFEDNWANDCQGHGFWHAFGYNSYLSSYPVGLHRDVAIQPGRIRLGTHKRQWAMGCNKYAMLTEHNVADNFGTPNSVSVYFPTANDVLGGADHRFTFEDFRLMKCGAFTNASFSRGLYKNRIGFGQYLRPVVGDHLGMGFQGQTAPQVNNEDIQSVIRHGLFIAKSLNRTTTWSTIDPLNPAIGAATYHRTLEIKDCTFVNYESADQANEQAAYPMGILKLDDLYVNGVFDFERFSVLQQLPPVPGVRLMSFNYQAAPAAATLAGAVKNSAQMFQPQVPASYWWVYGFPFLTYGAANLAPAARANTGYTTSTPFYAAKPAYTSFDNPSYRYSSWDGPVTWYREDASGTVQGEWAIADGSAHGSLFNMRAVALQQGGRYRLTFPTKTATGVLILTTSGISLPEQWVLMGVQYNATPARVFHAAFQMLGTGGLEPDSSRLANGSAKQLTLGANLAAVEASDGGVYWYDSSAQVVWTKVQGNLIYDWSARNKPDRDSPTYLIAIHQS